MKPADVNVGCVALAVGLEDGDAGVQTPALADHLEEGRVQGLVAAHPEGAHAEEPQDLAERIRREIDPIAARRKCPALAGQRREAIPQLGDPVPQGRGVPGLAGVQALDRPSAVAVGADVEVEGAVRVPVALPQAVAEPAIKAAVGEQADEVQALGHSHDRLDRRTAVREVQGSHFGGGMRLGGIEEMGIVPGDRELGAQPLDQRPQSLRIRRPIGPEAQRALGLAPSPDEAHAALALYDVPRLADPVVVQPHEVGVFPEEAGEEHLARKAQPLQLVHEPVECRAGSLIHRRTPRHPGTRRRGPRAPHAWSGWARPCRRSKAP